MTTSLEKELLIAASDDWVYFAELMSIVRGDSPELTETDLPEHAIAVAEEFAMRGLWQAGDVTSEHGFSAWSESPSSASARMRVSLRALDHPVWPGDICWFQITDSGQAKLRIYDPKA